VHHAIRISALPEPEPGMSVRPNRMAEPKLRTVRLGWKAQKGAGLPRRRGGMPSGVGRSTSSLPWSFGRDERARSGHHGHESPQNGAIKRRRVTYVWTYVVALCSLVFPWRASAAQRGAARGGLSLLGCQFVACKYCLLPQCGDFLPQHRSLQIGGVEVEASPDAHVDSSLASCRRARPLVPAARRAPRLPHARFAWIS
jgi:hypothetical protein